MIDELKAVRQSEGWSQRTLADRIGVDAQTVKRLENGVGSVENLVAAMDALDFRPTGLGLGATLADQLRGRRRARSLSLDKAASLAGLARGTVASLENGRGSIASLLRLLAALAPRARRRAPERSYWGQADKQDRDRPFTPTEFMEGIYAAFGEIDLDPCGHVLSPIVARRRILLSEGGDGLAENWSGRLAFVNPPFSELLKWLRRAHERTVAAMRDCAGRGLGALDEDQRLVVDAERLEKLSGPLRCYAGCAMHLAGEVDDGHIVRLDPMRKRLTIFRLADGKDAFPAITSSIAVDLRRQDVSLRNEDRVLVRKSVVFGMSARSKQRKLEWEKAEEVGIPSERVMIRGRRPMIGSPSIGWPVSSSGW